MGRTPQHSPSFFKVLIDDFPNKLQIPPVFVKKFRGKLTLNPIRLKTKSRTSWAVSIEPMGSRHYFSAGWLQFVKDNKLETGDFLVFWLIGDSTFQVVMYDRSCCEKKLNSANMNNITNPISEQNKEDSSLGRTTCCACKKRSRSTLNVKNMKIEDEKDGVFEAANHPSFVTLLKKHNRYVLSPPMWFLRETGIVSKRSTVLRDPEGRVWPVEVCLRKYNNRVDLTAGWIDFRNANKLGEGDTCAFKFCQNGGNVIDVQVVERSGRGRGRPPLNKNRRP